MNNSCISHMIFCRKCKRLTLSTYETSSVSEYKFLCKKCLDEEGLIGECRNCGREGVSGVLNEHGGYCHKCEDDNIIECVNCGSETYKHQGLYCEKCLSGENKQCIKCGNYFSTSNLTSDSLCEKCSIKIHKKLRSSQVNEVVECLQCGREELVNNMNDKGLCIYCQCEDLVDEIKKLKRKKKKKAYY